MEMLDQQLTLEQEYDAVILSAWHYQLKLYVDWFVVRYDKWLTKICKQVASKPGIWEDLKNDCIVEAYAIAKRFDPSKGLNLGQWLMISLKQYPYRSDHWKRYKPSIALDELDDEQTLANWTPIVEDFIAIDEQPDVYRIISGLAEHEKTLIHFKLLGLTNVQIATMTGRAESTIRARLDSALNKLKVKGDGR